MKLISPFYSVHSGISVASIEEAEAVEALESSLRSSKSLMAIVECAKKRHSDKKIASEKLVKIQEVCLVYQRHQREVRDHCLDYYNSDPSKRSSSALRSRTDELMREGRALYVQLREAILSSY